MSIDILIKLQPFAIALAIGLLIGIEREGSHPPGQQPLGSRTFVLLGLLGAVAARLSEPMIALAISIFVGAVVIAGYLRSSRITESVHDIGFTTEVAAVMTYGLGFLAYREPFVAFLIGITSLIVLMARTRLHAFSREQLKPQELQAIVTLMIMGIGVIPFLPEAPIDPWKLFSLQRFGVLLFLILFLQFAAHTCIRLLGATRGILLVGFLSGFVSSTTATATLAKKVIKNEIHYFTGCSAIVLSTSAMYLLVMVIIYFSSPDLLLSVAPGILISGIIPSLIALFLSQKVGHEQRFQTAQNPLSIISALRLALFLAGMLISVTLAQRVFGKHGVLLISFLGGMFEIRGVTLAVATLHSAGKMMSLESIHNLYSALVASFLTKFVVLWGSGRGRFTFYTSALLALMVALLIGVWVAVSLI